LRCRRPTGNIRRVNSTAPRFLGIAIALLLVGGAVAIANHGSDASGRPRPRASTGLTVLPSPRGGITCPPGPRIAIPASYPKDLGLPAGTYALDVPLPKIAEYSRVALAVPTSLRDFARHIATVWPKNGWVFTHAEVEFIDAEAQVSKASEGLAAAFVSRSVCDDTFVQLYMTYGKVRPPAVRPSPRTSS
jgi:hypothetical protein